MDLGNKFSVIQQSQIGCGLTEEEVRLVAEAVQWVEYKSGDVIFSPHKLRSSKKSLRQIMQP